MSDLNYITEPMATLNTPIVSLPRHPTSITVNNDQQYYPILSEIDRCNNLKQLKQIQAQMIKTGLLSDSYSASKLFTAAALSSFSSLDYARKVFDKIPQPNLYTWNTLIRAYSSSNDPLESIKAFLQMLGESSYHPNKFTFPFLIKAASEVLCLPLGQVFHGMVIKYSLGDDVYILNSLIHFYAMCGDLDLAYRVFVMIGEKDVVSWNSMISSFVQGGYFEKALELYGEMEMQNVRPNGVTMVGVLSACAKRKDLEFGKRVCSHIEKNGIKMDLTLSNAMLDMFVKCGNVDDAKRLFDRMEEKDIVSYTTMIDGYAKLGEYESARCIFDSTPKKFIATWNALISAYEQNGHPNEALALFHEMQLNNKNVNPDEFTLVSTLSACSQLGAMEVGEYIRKNMNKWGISLNCYLMTSLIDMYSKCGNLEKSIEVFCSAKRRDVFVWSAMIAGLAMHGHGRDAIDMFTRMQQAKVKPNAVTFTNILCACSHSGLVDEGKMFFGQMEQVYGISPGVKHYACMVDIFGRAGLLEEAVEFIEKMPICPSASVWGALLGACKIHENVELAELACTRLLELEPRNHGAHVLLSNIYAKTGKWEKVSELRKQLRVSGLKKEPGSSSIEADGEIHKFLAGDNSHPLSKEIYSKLDEIVANLKSCGYVPNKSQLLQLVEEEDMKEHALILHSEKLAMAFGLIKVNSSKPIRIVKNLRVCGDCHEVAKLISEVYDREILLRDRYRFHHFREGKCSCMDYW